MTSRSKSQLIIAIGLGLLVALVVWSFQEMRAAQASVDVAQQNLNHCSEVAKRIAEVRQRPTMAALEETTITSLATLIDEAATTSRISKSSIVRIEPQPSRRVGETDYKEQATYVELRGVSLQQLVSFMHTLLVDQSELDVTSLRITAPRYDSDSAATAVETWLAEVTLTYLIYSPMAGV